MSRRFRNLYLSPFRRVGTPGVEAELPFQAKHLEGFLAPIRKELERVGASQCCQQVRSADGLIFELFDPCHTRGQLPRVAHSRVLNLVRCAQQIPFALLNPLVVVIPRVVLFFHVANDPSPNNAPLCAQIRRK